MIIIIAIIIADIGPICPCISALVTDMPFITEVVMAEVEARARQLDPPASVPFFKNNDEESLFLRLRGRPMPS